MRLWIIACGAERGTRGLRCDAAGFDALCRSEAEGEAGEATARPMKATGWSVYAAPGTMARQTAERSLEAARAVEEPLLAPIPRRPFRDTGRRYPLWVWRLMAWLQRLLGSARQPESRQQSIERAETLIRRLERRGEDAILVVPLSFLPVLLDRLRLHGCCAARSEIGRFRPYERILVTRRDMHCGGCGHNCLLTNPGCGVGRDKAQRAARN